MNSEPGSDEDRLPESVASRILERAARIDSVAARTISMTDLRANALHDGITEVALNRALAENRAAALSSPAVTSAGHGYTGKAPMALTLFAVVATLILVLVMASAVLLRMAASP